MPRHRNGNGNGHRVSTESQLAVVKEHLERVKEVAIGLGESRGLWTASAAAALAAYIQEQTDAALLALKQVNPDPQALGDSVQSSSRSIFTKKSVVQARR
jgi:hypothetical protein